MKTLAAGPAGILQPGAAVEVDDAEGKALVAGGYADVVDAPKKAKSTAAKKDESAKSDDATPSGDTPTTDATA